MSEKQEQTALEFVAELHEFLQGVVPDGYRLAPDAVPKLTADQAWTVVWYLGNRYRQVPDHIERCGVCDVLFDTKREGTQEWCSTCLACEVELT